MKVEPNGLPPAERGEPGSVLDALDITLESLELTHEAAAHVASMRTIARKMDNTYDGHLLTKLANTLMRQQVELRQYRVAPAVEDPFDALARSLHGEDAPR